MRYPVYYMLYIIIQCIIFERSLTLKRGTFICQEAHSNSWLYIQGLLVIRMKGVREGYAPINNTHLDFYTDTKVLDKFSDILLMQ